MNTIEQSYIKRDEFERSWIPRPDKDPPLWKKYACFWENRTISNRDIFYVYLNELTEGEKILFINSIRKRTLFAKLIEKELNK